jgi:hypothetical protein
MIERACPKCGWTLTAGEPIDALVCLNCGAVLLITPDRELRVPTNDELSQFMARSDVAAMVAAVKRSNEGDE